MAHMALYRQWRPQDFDTLVGQDAIKQALTNALLNDRIAHAYLFSGPRGTGKTSTARILAKALNCEQGPTDKPCGCCSNCRKIADGSSMDVIEMDAASNRNIDDIRFLREQIAYTPVEGRFKVYIIDEVHMLTKEASNALLKTLEEPPEHAIFILATTDPQKVLPTIHSRCQRFEFHRVTVEDITKYLAVVAQGSGIAADEEALRLIAIQAEGGMRDALSLLDQCGVTSKHVTAATVREVLGIVGREALRELVEAIGRQKLPLALEKLNQLLAHGKDTAQVLNELMDYLRALLLYQAVPQYSEIYLTDTEEALHELAPLWSRDRLLAGVERLNIAVRELRTTMRTRITAELCLLDLCRMEGSTIAALAARVEQLERQLAAGAVISTTPADAGGMPSAAAVAQEKQPDALTHPAEVQQPVSATRPAAKLVAVQPQTLQAALAAKPAPQSAVARQDGEYAGDFAAGEDYWRQTLELMRAEKKNSMVSCAKNGRVYSFANNILRVAFKQAFLADRMNKEDYRTAFETVLLRIARCEIRLEAVIEGRVQPSQQAAKPAVAEKQTQAISQELQTAELPDKLRKALNAFGGTVTEI